MSDTSKALNQASDTLESCKERLRAVSEEHAFLATLHENLRQLHAQLAPSDVLRSRLDGEMGAAAQCHKNVADGHDALARSLEAAQLAVRGAADAPGADDSYVEPTHNTEHQGGVQGSGPGRLTKSFTPEAIRERDQRRGIEAGYLAKIKAMRGN